MSFLNMALRFVLLFASFFGYILWMKDRFNIRQEFSPIIICCGIGSLMFLAGILNILPIMALIIFLFGLIQLRYLGKIKKYLIDPIFFLHLAVLGICCIYFAFYVRNIMFTHYDNFSHWALVVKEILKNDSFPNFQNGIITFRSYPTGTASFIYYVCKVLGNTEGCMAFGQILILLSCIFTLFSFLKPKNWYLMPLIIGGGLYCLTSNVQITELLVDTVLPLLGIAAVAIIYYYRRQIKKCIWLSSPIFIFLITVKNSGLYFWIIGAVFLLYLICRQHMLKASWKQFIAFSLLIPYAVLYLWNRHVLYVFDSNESTKHAMSLDNYSTIFSEKTPEDIYSITKAFLLRTFSLQNEGLFILAIGIAIVLIGFFVFRKRTVNFIKSAEIRIAAFSIVIYILYMASMLCMYLFSMPLNEAVFLASYDRYNQTIVIFLYGVFLIYILAYLPLYSMKNALKILSSVCISLLILLPLWKYQTNIFLLFKSQDYTDTLRYQLETLKKDYQISEEKKYFVYISENQSSLDYCYYLTKYLLHSSQVIVCNSSTLENEWEKIDNYDYLVICSFDDTIKTSLEQKNMPLNQDVIVLP